MNATATTDTIKVNVPATAKGYAIITELKKLEINLGLAQGALVPTEEGWEEYRDVDGTRFPNYEVNEHGVIRNHNTRRVLRPNKKGRVNMKNQYGQFVQRKQTTYLG